MYMRYRVPCRCDADLLLVLLLLMERFLFVLFAVVAAWKFLAFDVNKCKYNCSIPVSYTEYECMRILILYLYGVHLPVSVSSEKKTGQKSNPTTDRTPVPSLIWQVIAHPR